VLGADGVKTYLPALAVASGLAIVYEMQGSFGEAEAMYKKVLQGYEAALGCEVVKTHVDALKTCYNLANLFTCQNRTSEAKEQFLRCQVGYEAVYGVEHEECIDVVRRLASLKQRGGDGA